MITIIFSLSIYIELSNIFKGQTFIGKRIEIINSILLTY